MTTNEALTSRSPGEDRPLIVVAAGIFGEPQWLAEHFSDVEFRFADLSDPGQLGEITSGAAGVVVALQPLRAPHIAAFAPTVRVIGRAGVGVDTIDLEAAAGAGVTVVNQPNYGTKEVASHAVAMLLALHRRLLAQDTFVRDGWLGSIRLAHMKPLDEIVVGLVGCGSIGRATAEMLLGLVGHVIAFDPADPPLPPGVERATELKDLLGRSDVVSLHVPLTTETAGMVDGSFLSAMVPGALFVNVSRGGLVDEAALVVALDSGQLGGAALDVFAIEPPPPTSPLLKSPNTLFTPHSASVSDRSFWRLATWTVGDTVSWVQTNTIEYGNIVVRGTR